MTAPLTDSDADALDVANRVAHELTPHAKAREDSTVCGPA
jgi:hypothetical protein